MQTKTLKVLGLVAVGYILLTSFKKSKLTSSVSVLDYQGNAPTGTKQVFSKVGSPIFDENFNIIYTYNTAGIGMTITGTKGTEMYSVVIGSDFANGIPGYVFKTDVQLN